MINITKVLNWIYSAPFVVLESCSIVAPSTPPNSPTMMVLSSLFAKGAKRSNLDHL